MQTRLSIRRLIRYIERLPPDRPAVYRRKWYTTQKQHWLGWLREYHRPGAYGRRPGLRRDARFVYNHIVEPKMLLWLISAAQVDRTKEQLAATMRPNWILPAIPRDLPSRIVNAGKRSHEHLISP
jgi:hypothetical protein